MALLRRASGFLVPATPPEAPPVVYPGGTFYLDLVNGSDAAAGTSGSPWRTFNGACLNAPIDSIVYVKGPVNRQSGPAFTSIEAIGDRPRTGWVTFAPDPAASGPVVLSDFSIANSSFIAFQDFRDGAQAHMIGHLSSYTGCHDMAWTRLKVRPLNVPVILTPRSGFSTRHGVYNIALTDCDIQPGQWDGTTNTTADLSQAINFSVSSSSSPIINNIVFTRCQFHDAYNGDVVQIKRIGNVTFDTCEFYNSFRTTVDPRTGIPWGASPHTDMMQTLYGGAGTLTLRNCIAHDADVEGFLLTDLRGQVVVILENNLFYRLNVATGTGDFVQLNGAKAGSAVVGNTIAGGRLDLNGAQAMTIDSFFNNVVGGTILKQNTVTIGAEGFNLASLWSSLTPAATSDTGSPTYVDAAGFDFRLAAGSRGRFDATKPGTSSPFGGYTALGTDRRGVAHAGDMGSEGHG